ncbi:IS701 family transposase [Streptomyces griseoruber]|uniref:IS701 family transposase n=1 Tax=Streptomyces griseoruber TaxID=1943 RepID=UPI000A5AB77D|nr:transposase [Streptomyces griseoruber]
MNPLELSSLPADHGTGGARRGDGPGIERAWHASAGEDIVGELCSLMFLSLPRRDQRQRGEQYVRGLLTTPGRKSVRNIAQRAGGAPAVQSLHHFVAGSTWDWRPMRAALATHLERIASPVAWVVQTMTIPKSGRHSVGVGRRFVPQLGQMLHGQYALGVWFASPRMSAPVDWRLLLPEEWERDAVLRRRAKVPESACAETVEESALVTLAQTLRNPNLARRPVILDVPGRWADPVVLDRFARLGLPVVARTTPGTRLLVADASMPGYGSGPLSAEQILMSVRGLRRTVDWDDPGHGVRQASSAVSIRVTTGADPGGGERRPLYLLGEWADPRQPPARMWLTDLAAPAGRLLRLTKLARRVRHDATTVGERVGLRDFEGRSFRGWHRHATLASVAHTAALLTGLADEPAAPPRERPPLSA